jgi:hypothetical protein
LDFRPAIRFSLQHFHLLTGILNFRSSFEIPAWQWQLPASIRIFQPDFRKSVRHLRFPVGNLKYCPAF